MEISENAKMVGRILMEENEPISKTRIMKIADQVYGGKDYMDLAKDRRKVISALEELDHGGYLVRTGGLFGIGDRKFKVNRKFEDEVDII